MKTILMDMVVFMLATAILLIFMPLYIPCLIYISIRDAYAEDRARLRMHRRIDEYLSRQRDDDYSQINTW